MHVDDFSEAKIVDQIPNQPQHHRQPLEESKVLSDDDLMIGD